MMPVLGSGGKAGVHGSLTIYRDLLTLEEEVKEVFPNPELLLTMNFTQLFRRKRTKYGYEEEVRLIANSFIFGQLSREKTIREISFAGIEDFIESVTVDPLAEDEHVLKVSDFCLAHNIPFAGRSKIQGCKHKKT